ncbi:hypothetical protein PENTCL1PPCAC_12920, partial [Pristionchus entomophagus]
TDTWISKGGRVSLNAVVATYLDDSWNLKSVVLAATPLAGRHTATTLQAKLERVIKFYDLNVGSVTSDSASNILKAVSDMQFPRIPCFFHQMHLIVSSSLDDWSDKNIIIVLKKLARTLNMSPSKREFFFELTSKDGRELIGICKLLSPFLQYTLR